MHSSLAIGLVALLQAASALPQAQLDAATAQSALASPKCTDFIIPVRATAPTKLIDESSVPQNLDDPTVLIDFLVSEAESRAAALLGAVGTIETTGTFNMSMRYCEPTKKVASRANSIQYLQHAITNTKNYWNGLTYPLGVNGNKYSWIAKAAAEGYPTLSVDNLGSGDSSHPDPIAVVQMSLQVEIIHQIISKLRAGEVWGPVHGKKFEKVIYAGHSYGSICGNALAATYPEDVDTYILTGYTGQFVAGLVPLAAGVALPAQIVKPRFEELPLGYLAQSVEGGRVYGLYTVGGEGGFDPAVAQADFDNEGTVAVGELATLFYGVTPADNYTGSVYVITGKQDAIVCNQPLGADCGEASNPNNEVAVAGKFFPNAKDYSYIIPDHTGHSANLHYSSPESFAKAHAYLASQGY